MAKNPNKKKNPTKRLLVILGILIALVVVVAIASRFMGNTETGVGVEVAKAEVRNLTQTVTASGKVQPEIEVQISPDVSGEIVLLTVKEGDWVERGQLLARIKSDFYAAQVEQAEANVSQGRASLAQSEARRLQAELEFNRKKELYERGVIPLSEFETVKTEFEVAKASVQSAQFSVESSEARLREAREQLNKTSIFSPMSGTVSQLDVELGERVVGTSQMSGTPMMTIARLDQMEIEVDVNENDVVNIAQSDTASIDIDAYPEQRFKGQVTEIANSARIQGQGTQEQVTNFPVKIRLVNANASEVVSTGQEDTPPDILPQFRPGMSGTVDIFTHTVFNVVAIPIQAVQVRDFNNLQRASGENSEDSGEAQNADSSDSQERTASGGEEDLRKVVFILADGKAKMVEVETGISDDTHIEIKSGLTGDEDVITGPYSVVSRQLRDGQTVRVETPNRGRTGVGA